MPCACSAHLNVFKSCDCVSVFSLVSNGVWIWMRTLQVAG